jgi:hypothetical protein
MWSASHLEDFLPQQEQTALSLLKSSLRIIEVSPLTIKKVVTAKS